MTDDIQIVGGADPEIAAAIAAVIDQVILIEHARDTGEPERPIRSRWAMSEHIKPPPHVHRFTNPEAGMLP